MVTIESIFEALDFFPEPARLCQTFFLLSASAVLVVAATPPSTRGLLTQYGARSSSPAQKTKEQIEAGNANKFTNLIRSVTSVGNVPHSWFIHFYILSVANSFFWALQYACNGTVLETIAKHQTARNPGPSMTLRQVQLTWFLMATQGARRLYECLFVMRASSSKMWVIHWLLGCAYYLCIGVAVWVEGADAILRSSPSSIDLSPISTKELVGLSLFLFAWSMQHLCHKHLASLKKYSLPEVGMFRYLVCPHYTCECLLYLSLAILAAPPGQPYNQTILCGLAFVAANLGVTTSGTRKWYADKFGTENIKHKWNMIPFVY